MRFGAAGQAYCNFLAKEEVRARPQGLGTFDGVMICNGNSSHAPLLEEFVHFKRLVVALLTQVLEPWSVEHSRSCRVEMEIAAHGVIVGFEYEQPVKREQNLRKCALGT